MNTKTTALLQQAISTHAARRRRIPCQPECPGFCTADRVTGETPVLQAHKNGHFGWQVAGKGGDHVAMLQELSRCPKKQSKKWLFISRFL
ncbi:MAG: hypothetical protein ACP5DZ_06985 [Bacteroidales bacterium]